MSDIPARMQAVVQSGDGYSGTATGPTLEHAGDWLKLTEIPVPEPGVGQVLIKVRKSSVNPSDIHFIKGEYGQPRKQGTPAGFEGCGDVVIGPKHLIGQRVAFVTGATGSGAWAEYTTADSTGCIPLRPDISDTDGAAQIVNPLTAMAMVHLAKAAGNCVIITAAASQLGKLMIGLARDQGMTSIATVRRDAAIAALENLGATKVLNTQAPDFAESAHAAIKALKPQVMLDAVGDQTSETLFMMMPNRARWVSYGKLSSAPPALTQMGQFIFMGKQIEGFWLSKWFRETAPADQIRAVQEVQARFADGRWRTEVSGVLQLDQVVDGLAEMLRKPDGKVMIDASKG
jgi:NADPH:quinone reductase-like Zn-dependent oxidoreductase